ncbi:hypothetical protein N431DRAFT_278583, partial [Stipitochalara longipes BDJ]
SLVVIAGASFLCFLWWGTIENNLWRHIILNNWAARAITLTSTALRAAVTIQSGLCLSMLAALALEKSAVPLDNVCFVSLMRASGSQSLLSTLTDFACPMARRSPRQDRLLLPAILLTLTLTSLSQFMSTALFFDATIQLVPGYNKTVEINYDFTYQSVLAGYNYSLVSPLPLWQADEPSQWPMFAEYSELPAVQDGVSDTGVSLRAFLPLGVQERQLVRNYSGKALVLDSRVTCQRPVLDAVNYTADNAIQGLIRPSTLTPRLDSPDTVPFQCTTNGGMWGICELNENAILNNSAQYFSGGLVSEFRNFPLSPGQNKSGAAFLVTSTFNYSMSALGTEFISVNMTDTEGDLQQVALTLCYTSLDVADRWIDAHGDKNRTEPSPAWVAHDYNLTAVIAQLDTGYAPALSSRPSAGERGIMQLRPPVDWAAPPSDQPLNDGPSMVWSPADPVNLPFLTWRLHLRPSAPSQTDLGGANLIVQSEVDSWDFLTVGDSFDCNLWLARLFEHFLTNSSTSVALQAIITSLAGIEYYRRLYQFDKSDDVSLIFFVNTYTPGGPFGQKRTTVPWGLGGVMILLAIHFILVAVVTARFSMQTHISHIGDEWQAFAQVARSDVEALENKLENAIKLQEEEEDEEDEEGEEVAK